MEIPRHDKIEELQKLLLTNVYPEMVKMIRMVGLGKREIGYVDDYGRTYLHSNGELLLADIIIGNVFESKKCPLYMVVVSKKYPIRKYIKYAQLVLSSATDLKKDVKEINDIIEQVYSFSNVLKREIILEKTGH